MIHLVSGCGKREEEKVRTEDDGYVQRHEQEDWFEEEHFRGLRETLREYVAGGEGGLFGLGVVCPILRYASHALCAAGEEDGAESFGEDGVGDECVREGDDRDEVFDPVRTYKCVLRC